MRELNQIFFSHLYISIHEIYIWFYIVWRKGLASISVIRICVIISRCVMCCIIYNGKQHCTPILQPIVHTMQYIIYNVCIMYIYMFYMHKKNVCPPPNIFRWVPGVLYPCATVDSRTLVPQLFNIFQNCIIKCCAKGIIKELKNIFPSRKISMFSYILWFFFQGGGKLNAGIFI